MSDASPQRTSPASSGPGHMPPERATPRAAKSWLWRVLAILLVLAGVTLLWVATADRRGREPLWSIYAVRTVVVNVVITFLAFALLYVGFAPGSRRSRALRVSLLAGSVACCLAILELPVFAFGYSYESLFGNLSAENWLQRSSLINKPDPKLIHIHWPHSEYRGTVVGNLVQLGIPNAKPYSVDVRYDRNGFRNDSDLESADVVIIGDSFVEAAIMPLSDTAVKELERRIGKTVANLGQAAYGLKQELEVLKRFGRPLAPKYVFWFFFGGNDLRDVENYEQQLALMSSRSVASSIGKRSFVRNTLVALSRLTCPAPDETGERALTRSGWFKSAD